MSATLRGIYDVPSVRCGFRARARPMGAAAGRRPCAAPVRTEVQPPTAVPPPAPPAPQDDGDSKERAPRRRLIMMRHANSHEGAEYRDHARPLTEAGRRAASDCASKLATAGWLPQFILSSDSLRTKETLEEMADVDDSFKTSSTVFLSSLYTVAALDGQTGEHLLQQLRDRVPDDVEVVMCVGHNKGWEEAASEFCGAEVELKGASAALLEGWGHTWEEVTSEEAALWTLKDVIDP